MSSPADAAYKLWKFFQKIAGVSSYEFIDGYVSAPMGRSDEDVRAEVHNHTSALAPDEKEKLVDQLVAAAKERREKAAKQRAEGKADLADRTEAQARSLEVAADELNKQLPEPLQRKVDIAPRPGEEKPVESSLPGGGSALLRPAVLVPVGVLAVALAITGGLVLTSGDGDDSTDAGEADELITDPAQPLSPVVQGTFEYNSPKASFTQDFIGRYPAPTCEAYGQGTNGRFETPYVMYPTGTRLDPSMSVNVTIRFYRGPGSYDNSGPDLSGGIGARGADGISVSRISAVNFSQTTFTAASDASGRVSFSGDDLQNTDDTVSGQMSWTCSNEHIDLDAYETNPYPS